MTLIPQEGAWFSLAHVSPDRVAEAALPRRFAGSGERPLGNAILALVTRRDFSALHRLRTEETWHFYDGDPLELLLLGPGGAVEVARLGREAGAGERAQVTVPPGVWMGARPARAGGDSYSFFGCTLAPGFDYSDYEHGVRAELQAGWPSAAALIAALTREAGDAPESDVAGVAEAGRVIGADEVAPVAPGAGVRLQEIVGRKAAAIGREVSMTRFRLAPGAGTGRSRYLAADEYFYILSGRGAAEVGGVVRDVAAGDVVVVPRSAPHAMTALPGEGMEFLAVIAPAFDPRWFRPE